MQGLEPIAEHEMMMVTLAQPRRDYIANRLVENFGTTPGSAASSNSGTTGAPMHPTAHTEESREGFAELMEEDDTERAMFKHTGIIAACIGSKFLG